MRTIKFRAWLIETNEMVQVDKMYLVSNGYEKKWHIDTFHIKNIPFYSFKLMQFTGLRDKNGVEIYENDKYKSNYYTGKPGFFKRIVGFVKYHNCGFVLEGTGKYKGLRVELHQLGEVIGNIHENKELI